MKEVADVSQTTPYRTYNLPHHCIERPDSVTVQGDLFSLILRLRTHRYVIIADIEKMYRQIQVHPSDQCLQRILWRDDPSEPIRIHMPSVSSSRC